MALIRSEQVAKVILATLIGVSMSTSTEAAINWNCNKNVSGMQFDVQRMAGEWYEIARVPESDVPACVKVTAPENVVDNNYILQLEYVFNANRKWEFVSEELSFPWNNSTQNGIFVLKYGEGSIEITIDFKLVGTDYDTLALVCGYSAISSEGSLIKVLTREPHLNKTVIEQWEQLVQDYDVDVAATWVEHSERCSAHHILPHLLTTIVMGLFGLWILFS